MRKYFARCMVGLALVASLYSPWVSAQTYESDLRTLAGNLAARLEAAKLRSVTVIDFTDLQGTPTELGRFLAQELSDKLVGATNTISVVDRANVQFLLRENKLSIDRMLTPETSRKLGNLIGVDTIMIGTTTPIGDAFRLSVRAISVDTGRIVGSNAVTLSPSKDLAQLYNRGVAGVQTGTPGVAGARTQAAADLRTRLRPESIKVTVRELVVTDRAEAVLSISVENLSGERLGLGILGNALLLDSCVASYRQEHMVNGLPLISDFRMNSQLVRSQLRMTSLGEKIVVIVTAFVDATSCGSLRASSSPSAEVSLTLVVADEKQVTTFPSIVQGTVSRRTSR